METEEKQEDQMLVAACQSQLPYVTNAFETLVKKYEARVYQACYQYLRRAEEAEEACQDVFLKVFRNLGKFRGDASFKTWVWHILLNVCATAKQKQQRLAERQSELDLHWEIPFSSNSADFGRHTQPQLYETLEKLSHDEAEILVMRHVMDLSFDEMAGILKVKTSTAKMRLYRATERFKQVFSEKK